MSGEFLNMTYRIQLPKNFNKLSSNLTISRQI